MTKAKTTVTAMATKTTTTRQRWQSRLQPPHNFIPLRIHFVCRYEAENKIKFSGRTVDVSCLGLMNSGFFLHILNILCFAAILFAFDSNDDSDLAWIYEAQTPNVANTREQSRAHTGASILQQTQLSSSRSNCRRWPRRRTKKAEEEHNNANWRWRRRRRRTRIILQ